MAGGVRTHLTFLALGWLLHSAYSVWRAVEEDSGTASRKASKSSKGGRARGGPASSSSAAEGKAGRRVTKDPGAAYKMVLVVNGELRMGKGKVGAQCAHAAVGACEAASHRASGAKALGIWDSQGQAKICLAGSSTRQLEELQASAKKARIISFLVEDAGRTQVAAGSRTVLAIGPAEAGAVDAITGALKLL